MSKEQIEVIDDASLSQKAQADQCTANSANSAYTPSAADLRHTALHMAISIKPPGHTKAASVVEDAQAFEAYLKGEG